MASMGASQAMFMALASTLVQEVVPDHLRGRVTAAYLMGTGGVMSISNLLSGTLADQFGVPAVLLVPALIFVAALLLLTGAIPGLRRLFRSGTLPIDVAASPA